MGGGGGGVCRCQGRVETEGVSTGGAQVLGCRGRGEGVGGGWVEGGGIHT